MSTLDLDTTASCACGAISIGVKGRILSMLLCSCLDCRKTTGTGHSTIIMVRRVDFSLTGPTRGFERIAASGSAITRHFCPTCGTPLFAETQRAPDVTLVHVGVFDDPHWFAPSQAIFTRTHLPWDTLPNALPRYETYRPADKS